MVGNNKQENKALNDSGSQTIIIRRVKKVAGGHHGGAWKIAYADFVTAMMAFFLLMWLLANTDQEMKDNLQEAFDKYKVFTSSGESPVPSQEIRKTKAQDGDMQAGPDTTERLGRDLKLDKFESGEPSGRLRIESHDLGVRVEIMDIDKQNPMFKIGEAQLTPKAMDSLRWLADRLNILPYKIIIEGHTDATSFSGNKKTNIHLSTLRALEARDALSKWGVNKDRFLKVIGHGSNKPLIKNNIYDSRNRRITVTILSYGKKFDLD